MNTYLKSVSINLFRDLIGSSISFFVFFIWFGLFMIVFVFWLPLLRSVDVSCHVGDHAVSYFSLGEADLFSRVSKVWKFPMTETHHCLRL